MLFTNRMIDNNMFDFLYDDFLFNSSVKDMNPTVFYQKDDNYIIEAKTLGIAPDDIKVSLKDDIITIMGETKNEYSDNTFNAKIKIRIGRDLIKSLEKIDYKSENGITYVILKTEKPVDSKIEINRI